MKHYTLKPEYHRVLIKQFPVMDEVGSSRLSVFSNDTEREIAQAAHPYGEIVALGSTAFKRDRWGEECECVYEVGDHVYFKKYPGVQQRSMTDDLARPQGDYLYTVNDVDVLGHVEIEVKDNA